MSHNALSVSVTSILACPAFDVRRCCRCAGRSRPDKLRPRWIGIHFPLASRLLHSGYRHNLRASSFGSEVHYATLACGAHALSLTLLCPGSTGRVPHRDDRRCAPASQQGSPRMGAPLEHRLAVSIDSELRHNAQPKPHAHGSLRTVWIGGGTPGPYQFVQAGARLLQARRSHRRLTSKTPASIPARITGFPPFHPPSWPSRAESPALAAV